MNDYLKYNLIGVSSVIAMVVFATVSHKQIKFVLGIAIVIALIISLIESQRSLELTNVQKRISWIILFPLVIIVISLYDLIK